MADIRDITEEYNSGTVQPPIFLDGYDSLYRSVQLAPIVAGVGYIQASLSTHQAILDNEGEWVSWPAGSISSASQDTIDPTVTAIRVYLTSGGLRLDLRLV